MVAWMDAFAFGGMALTCPAVTFEVVAVVGIWANAGAIVAAANTTEAANMLSFFI